MSDIISFIKPSADEAVAFITMFFILIVSLQLYQSMVITNRVRNDSLCYKNKINGINDTISVNVQNTDGTSLYGINYNIPNKSVALSCMCPTGNVANKFDNIKVYGFDTHTSQYSGSLWCSCDSQYSYPYSNIFGSAEQADFFAVIRQFIINSWFNSIIIAPESADLYEKIINDSITMNAVNNTISNNIGIIINVSINYSSFLHPPSGVETIVSLASNDSEKTLIKNTILSKTVFLDPHTPNPNPLFSNLRYYDNLSLKQPVEFKDSDNIIIATYLVQGFQMQSEYSKNFNYSGDPDVIRYMQTDDTYVFDRNLTH